MRTGPANGTLSRVPQAGGANEPDPRDRTTWIWTLWHHNLGLWGQGGIFVHSIILDQNSSLVQHPPKKNEHLKTAERSKFMSLGRKIVYFSLCPPNKMPRRGKQLPAPVFLPGKSHGERSLEGYSSWGHKESDTSDLVTKQQSNTL